MLKSKFSEKDLAVKFIKWLNTKKYRIEVFQEVDCCTGRPDIVVLNIATDHLTIFELKLIPNFSLIHQCVHHILNPCVDFVYAVCLIDHRKGHKELTKVVTLKKILSPIGIGLIVAHKSAYNNSISFREEVKAAKLIPVKKLKLFPGHKILGKAGSNSDTYWTEWKQINLELLEYVRDHDNVVIKGVEFIYLKYRPWTKYPGNCLRGNINKGHLKGLELIKIKNVLQLQVSLNKEGLEIIKKWKGKIKGK